MRKVINPCVCSTYYGDAQAYAEITYSGGKLSIHGVIGPKRNGNCKGSAGQCIDEIRKGRPVGAWNEEMLQKFCDIWERWHLNDMRAYCQHMKELGWTEHTQDNVKIETWTLTKEAQAMKDAAKNRALECLKKGHPFYPTKDEVAYANMEYSMEVYNDEDQSYRHGKLYRDAYELKEKDCLGKPYTEYQKRCWIRYSKHPLGFLGRPCPVCGYEYGTKWIKEEVPQDVIEWLHELPDTRVQPAWI